jgi:bifunctional oligoribonuclease and PAP phosphatase NrnA
MDEMDGLIGRLRKARRAAIFTHQRPDPDALGSQSAAAYLLKALGATAIQRVLFTPSVGPYQFLVENAPGTVPLFTNHWVGAATDFDTILLVDTCTYQQLEPATAFLKANHEKVVAIDHHLSRDDIGTLLYTDRKAAACVEILWELAGRAGIPLDANLALPLMSGLVGDTGWFRFDSVRPETHRMAADLVRFIDPSTLYERLMQNETKSKLGLMQQALASLRWTCGDRLACMLLKQSDFKAVGATPSQTEYLVDMPMIVGTVEVVALLTEMEDGRVRASLRSKHKLDVNKICNKFQGGGHAKAAGCRFEGPLETAYSQLQAAVEDALTA